MFVWHIVVYALSFVGIWVGSGIAIRSVERISHRVHISSFLISFFVLGAFTSASELSVGINSIIDKDPEIFVGNLIGASIVLFLLAVPLLAVAAGTIHINDTLKNKRLLLALIVVAIPGILALDGVLSSLDSIVAIGAYLFLVFMLRFQSPPHAPRHASPISIHKSRLSTYYVKQMSTVLVGIIIIFISSHFVVEQTVFFANVWGLSPFFVSLMLIAVGTNIPELSLVVRSLFIRNQQIAFGDYVGSAAFNTFLLGALVYLNGQPVQLTNSYRSSLLFLLVGLIILYLFARTKHAITRREGFLLLGVYTFFVVLEYFTHWR